MGARQGAVCAPSRAMLFTGRGLYRFEQPFNLPATELMLPELLRQHGYDTFATGKWHCGREAFARAFTHAAEVFFGGMGSHTELQVSDFDPDGVYPREASHTLPSFSSTTFVDAAIEFVRSRDGSRPWFAHVAFTAPHDPRTPPEEFRAMYDPADLTLPANFLPEHPFDNGELRVRDEKLAPWPRTPEVTREHLADYYGMISQMDDQVGRLLDALDETGQAENTLVVFASDHGLALGSHGLFGKQSLYEHSMRAPLILRGPGVLAGQSSDALVYLHDFFPTVCSLVGIETPSNLDGRDLTALFDGTPEDWRDEIFLTYSKWQRALCTERWKLIYYPSVGETQLFDLRDDPAEREDLAEDPARSGQVEQLFVRLQAAQRAAGDELDLKRR